MSVLLQFCFISVVGGYVNVAQITSITAECPDLEGVTWNGCKPYVKVDGRITGDKTPEAFLKRIEATCGGKSK